MHTREKYTTLQDVRSMVVSAPESASNASYAFFLTDWKPRREFTSAISVSATFLLIIRSPVILSHWQPLIFVLFRSFVTPYFHLHVGILLVVLDPLPTSKLAYPIFHHHYRNKCTSVAIYIAVPSSPILCYHYFVGFQNQNQNQNRFIRSYYRPRRPPLRPIWSLSQRPPGKKYIHECMYVKVKLVNT